MDFAPTESQEAVRELAAQVLGSSDPWGALLEAELVHVALPEEAGGAGLGLLPLVTLCEEVGRAGVDVPVVETALAGLALARGGRAVPEGVLALGLAEPASRDLLAPGAMLGRGSVVGRKHCVRGADEAAVLVVSGRERAGVALAVVDPRGPGVELERQVSTNGGVVWEVTLEGASAERLGDAKAVREIVSRLTVLRCAVQLGMAREALRLTAAYVSERHQFGVPIGTFQAVSQRVADAWIDVEAMGLTTWQAAWRLSAGLPADREVAIARYWACEAAHRVQAAAMHLHGGMGFDRDYPLHRYFLGARRLEVELGGAPAALAELGDQL